MDDYVAKPVKKLDLVRVLETWAKPRAGQILEPVI